MSEVYLYTGAELGQREDAVKSLRQAFIKKYGTIEEYSFYAGQQELSQILEVLDNVSLFCNATFVILKNADLLKSKQDIEALCHFIKKGNSTSCLILTSDEYNIDKKLESAVPKTNCRKFWEMFEDRKPQWLRDFFTKGKLKITEEAIEEILELVENNTLALRSACNNFFDMFEVGHTVTIEDVDKLLSHNKDESTFTLFDTMSNTKLQSASRLEKSLEILQKLLLSKDTSAVSLIAGLSYSFRMLSSWHKLYSSGDKPSDFDLKIKGFSSKKAQQRYSKASHLWDAKQTVACLALLSYTDMQIRQEGASTQTTRLALMLYELILKNGSPHCVYESKPL